MMHAIIFDFDGLVVDTESAIYEAWRELYLHHDHDLPLPGYVQCVGSTFGHYDPMAALELLTGGPVEWEAVLRRKDARIHELQRDIDTMPGIRALLAEAHAKACRAPSPAAASAVMCRAGLIASALETRLPSFARATMSPGPSPRPIFSSPRRRRWACRRPKRSSLKTPPMAFEPPSRLEHRV